MIKKLKFKFIILTMSSLLILLAVIVTGVNIMNYNSLKGDADSVLSIISKGDGKFPNIGDGKPGGGRPFSPELPYESRFFSVLMNDEGSIIKVDISHIASVDYNRAVALANDVFSGSKNIGFSSDFRYYRYVDKDLVRITFLDCGRKLDTFRSFLLSTITISLTGYITVLIIVTILAGKIIRPISESYEKQKRFITDAGHEIKTPLTIITANVDILEMDNPDNESISDIRLQTKRLTELTNDLVYLSRMEEKSDSLTKVDFPLSDLVCETVAAFKAPAVTHDITINADIQPMISMNGDSKSIEKLISVLMNNALKYSPDNGAISIVLKTQGRQTVLSVTNTSSVPVEREKLSHVFDRFYRTDNSRNSSTGGNGIGLSIAHAIVTAHGGKITASTDNGSNFRITVIM